MAWRAEVIEYFEMRSKCAKYAWDEIIRQLECEILRKDIALAEVFALLLLQNEVDLFWEVDKRS